MEKEPRKTQAVLIVVNIILVVAVAILFYLYFNRPEEPVDNLIGNAAMHTAMNKRANAIAFVNSDKILEEYLLVKKLTDHLESERKAKDADFSKKQKQYEKDAAYFQESVQKQSLSEESAQRIYEQLMAKQDELYQLQDQYSSEMAQKEYEMNMTLLDSVKNYLDRINVNHRFDYILNYNAGGAILLAKDTFDITTSVIRGLNKEYLEKYPSKK